MGLFCCRCAWYLRFWFWLAFAVFDFGLAFAVGDCYGLLLLWVGLLPDGAGFGGFVACRICLLGSAFWFGICAVGLICWFVVIGLVAFVLLIFRAW